MSMGNYFNVHGVLLYVMAASTQTVGFDHLTVVPENFDSEEQPQREDGESAETDRE
jgi:hypothetical protein